MANLKTGRNVRYHWELRERKGLGVEPLKRYVKVYDNYSPLNTANI